MLLPDWRSRVGAGYSREGAGESKELLFRLLRTGGRGGGGGIRLDAADGLLATLLGAEREGSIDGGINASVVRAMDAADLGGDEERENEGIVSVGSAAEAFGVVCGDGSPGEPCFAEPFPAGNGGGDITVPSFASAVAEDCPSCSTSSTTICSCDRLPSVGGLVDGGCSIRG